MKPFGRSADDYHNEAKQHRKERKARMKRAREALRIKRKALQKLNKPPILNEATNESE